MKFLVVVIGILLTIANLAFAKAKIGKPLEAEQNFQMLKRNEMKRNQDNFAKLIDDDDDLEEGSGDLDDDYYDDYDEEDYEDDDYYDEPLDEGSGDEDDTFEHLLPSSPQDNKLPLKPDNIKGWRDDLKNDDFYLVDDLDQAKESSYDDDDDLLYEYNNDLLYGDDEYDDDYLDEVEKDLDFNVDTKNTYEVQDNLEVIVTKTNDHGNSRSYVFRPAYIFLMLASALVSFAFFTLIFILCRKSILERQKQKLVPFVVSSGFHTSGKPTPIVKNYQRVPTSTKEMMKQPQHQTMVEMGLPDTKKPLLT